MFVGNIGHEATNRKENAIENKRPTKHHLRILSNSLCACKRNNTY